MIAALCLTYQVNAQSGIALDARDGIEWLRDQKQYIARGDAVMKRDGLTLKSDEIIVHYDDADGGDIKVKRMDAIGSVFVSRDDLTASGARATYHIEDKVAVMIGDKLEINSDRGNISANESLEFWDARNIVVARGNATTRHAQGTLKANVISAFLKNNKDNKRQIDRIEALGNIIISNGNEIIKGEKGIYYIDQEFADICGNVKITRGANQLNGKCAQIDFKSGNSKIIGDKNKRIQGLILPD